MAYIRQYRPEDYQAVRRNLEAEDMWHPPADVADNLSSMVEQNPDAILVAEVDGEVVGSIYTTPFGINIGLIWRLVVSEQHRRKGIATQLLDTMAAKLKEQGVKEIWGFIDTSKPELEAFYKKHGYIYNPDHTFFAIWEELE